MTDTQENWKKMPYVDAEVVAQMLNICNVIRETEFQYFYEDLLAEHSELGDDVLLTSPKVTVDEVIAAAKRVGYKHVYIDAANVRERLLAIRSGKAD